jgi:uncharacterized protein
VLPPGQARTASREARPHWRHCFVTVQGPRRPALGWRLDKHWKRVRDEVPHLTRAPSEVIREHFYVSTQPMEETDDPTHVLDAMGWIGFDRILFASDYPHWDFDDPVMAIPPNLGDAQRRMVLSDNARAVYRLG